MRSVVDVAQYEQAQSEVDHDQASDLRREVSGVPRQRRLVDAIGHQQHPEQPEDGAAGADRDPRVRERVAGGGTTERAQDVDEQELGVTVQRLHDGSDDPQGVHVEAQVEDAVVDQDHGQQPPVVARGDLLLAQLEEIEERSLKLRREDGEDADADRDGDDRPGHIRIDRDAGA